MTNVEEFNFIDRKTKSFSPDKEIKDSIRKAKKNLKKLLGNVEQSNQSEILNQLDKINSLKPIKIPTSTGYKDYYAIADSAGGVTEKTCLIDSDTLKKKLFGLATIKQFDELKQNKIQMNAILKHPKAGKDTEVQREAIGLKIARILGFNDVTESTIVNHNTGSGRHPCLFVPFGKMELLSEKIENANTSKGRLKQECFQTVEDFGKYIGYFALCSDPDFIGKAGQNKGLTGDGPEKRLYIFDQVFMSSKNLSLDRSFNLVPTNILSKTPNFIARHFMGRNKSVINDSSFEEKINGVINILQKKEEIQRMFNDVIKTHKNKGNNLQNVLSSDAKECLKSFNNRLVDFQKLFPRMKIDNQTKKINDLVKENNQENLNLLKKSMLVTKLINKPRMNDKNGKKFRVPFLINPTCYVKWVSLSDSHQDATLHFSKRFGFSLSENQKSILREKGFTISQNGKSATIDTQKLLQLNVDTLLSKENITCSFRKKIEEQRDHHPVKDAQELPSNTTEVHPKN